MTVGRVPLRVVTAACIRFMADAMGFQALAQKLPKDAKIGCVPYIDACHTRAVRCGQTFGTVFEHKAIAWRDSHTFSGKSEHLGVRFWLLDIIAGDDHIKASGKPRRVQKGRHNGALAVRGQGFGQVQAGIARDSRHGWIGASPMCQRDGFSNAVTAKARHIQTDTSSLCDSPCQFDPAKTGLAAIPVPRDCHALIGKCAGDGRKMDLCRQKQCAITIEDQCFWLGWQGVSVSL